MKYKLIHNKTKEETICSLATIDGFDYYISDEIAKTKEYYYSILTNSIGIGFIQKNKDLKKVICTNNPNIDIPEVIDELHLEIKKYVMNPNAYLWIKKVVNKAKETYKYTKEELIDFAHYYFREEFNSSMQSSKSTE